MPSIDDFDPLFDASGQRWHVDPDLIKGHAFVESGGNPNARNPSGAAGMMQITGGTRDMIAKGLGQKDFDPMDPRDAINGAGWLISQNLDRYRGDTATATQAYNGFGHGSDPNYVQQVMAARNRFADSASAVGKSNIPSANAADTPPTITPVASTPTAGDAATAGGAATAPQSTDDLLKLYGPGAAGTATGAGAAGNAPQTAPVPQSTGDLLKLYGPQGPTGPAATPAAAPAVSIPAPGAGVAGSPSVATPAPIQWGEVNPLLHSAANAVVGGVGTGLGTIATTAGNLDRATGGYLSTALGNVNRSAFGSTGDMSGAGMIPPPDVQEAMAENPLLSGVGRVAGQVIGTAPAMIAGGEALGAAGAATKAVPYIGSGIKNALTAAGDIPYLGPLISGATRGAGAGAAQAGLTSGQDPNESVWSQMVRGGEFGGALGAGFSGVGRMFFGTGRNIPEVIANTGQDARRAGITVLPENLAADGSLGAAPSLTQKGQINQAFGRVLGENTPDFTPGTLAPTLDKVGGQISDAVKAGQVNYQAIQNDLANVEAQATAPGVNADTTAKIRGKLNDILQAASANNGVLSGQQFDTFVGKGSDLSNWAGSKDEELAGLAQKLDGVLDRGFATSSPPGVYDQYVDAKTRFRLLKAVQDNVEGDPLGNIKPGSIMTDVQRRFPDLGTLTGKTGGVPGQIADLSRTVKQLYGGGGSQAASSVQLPLWAKLGIGGSGLTGAASGVAEGYHALGSLVQGFGDYPIATTGAGGAAGLAPLGRLYQRSPAFTNALIQRARGMQNPLLPGFTAAGTAAAQPAVNQLLTPSPAGR